MHRRTFLGTLTAASALGLLRPRVASAALPAAKITRVRIYRPPNLNPLFNQSNMVVTVETDIGITGIGEGGSKDTLEQCAGTLIGKNPFRIEAIWQESVHRLVLPAGTREDARARRARPRAVGHQGQGARRCPSTNCSGGAARDYCECYATGGARPAGAGRTSRSASRSAPARRWRPGIARSAWALATCRSATCTTRAPSSAGSSRTAATSARASAPTATGASTSISASISTTRVRVCKVDGALRAVLRRGSGARRARAAGHPQAAADDHGAADARRGVGAALGLQPARREP